jgi:hypothetical protein
MFNRKLCTGSAVLACLALFRTATGAPAFQVLYHEKLEITPRVDAKGQQHVSFDAYGRHFDVNLELNENIRRVSRRSRSDIKPYRGTVSGQTGSWVRLTQTRDGWRGVISDGHELYAIEPENELRRWRRPRPVGGRCFELGARDVPARGCHHAGWCGLLRHGRTRASLPGARSGHGAQGVRTHRERPLHEGHQRGNDEATRRWRRRGSQFTDNVGSDPETRSSRAWMWSMGSGTRRSASRSCSDPSRF